METILDTADTWFYEASFHRHPDELVVNVVEGIKGPRHELVDEDVGSPLGPVGPYFPVRVQSESRCVSVRFFGVLAYQIVDEFYNAPQTDFVGDEGVLRKCSGLAYLTYLQGDSLIEQLRKADYQAFLMGTEDQTIFVICSGQPVVELTQRLPDFTIRRGNTVYSSR